MKLTTAEHIGSAVVDLLKPHCDRIQIAGSLRRKCSTCKDIEIVCIPKMYEVGLFESGIATVVNQWHKVKGNLPCKYTQRLIAVKDIIPAHRGNEIIKLDLFFATKYNWGYILAIRTGTTRFSQNLASTWKKKGYHGKDGMLRHQNGRSIAVPEEKDLFYRLGIGYVEPENRNL